MGSFCLDLFTIIIGCGAVLFLLLGTFSLLKFEVIENFIPEKRKNDYSIKQLALVFWITGIIYIAILSVLIYFNYFWNKKIKEPIQ